jgi:non-ribosomal peptide synthetase component F
MIGLFVNTLALHVDLTGDPSFVGLLERVRELTLEARAREDVPFERLVDAVAPVRDLGTTPLFQIMLAFQNTPEESMEIQGTVLEVVHPRSTTAKFDITLFARETDGQLLLRFEYNRDLFERSTLEHLGVQIEALLAAAVTQPETPISRLPLPGLGEGFSPPSWQELETAAVAAPRRAEHVPPETELELVLAEFWSEVLEIDVDRVGIEDDFFEDGGHSLKATQLLLRVREAFGAQVPVRRFLERPTLAALAEAIAEVLLAEAEAQDAEDAEDAENAENAERA